jgi:hypothetical protein
VHAAQEARRRIVAVAVDGLRAGAPQPLPGSPPSLTLFTERWRPTDAPRATSPSPSPSHDEPGDGASGDAGG